MTSMLERMDFDTDVLVIGSGAAGCLAAIKAKEEEAQVLVATKGPFPCGNTSIAFGGYAVALDPRDSPDLHAEDTMKVGGGLNNHKVVKAFINEVVKVTKEMDAWGIDLVKKEGRFDLKYASDHTFPRIVHHYDATGRAVMKCLGRRAREVGIRALEDTIISGLLLRGGEIAGAWGVHYHTGNLVYIRAKSVVLATGGMGHLFTITDNARPITGEGYVLAFRAGAELIDMEMIDFHLTPCYPERMKGYQIMSAGLLHGGKGRLYNGLGERFIHRHYPGIGESQCQHYQSNRAAGIEIFEGRATEHGGVYLDASDVTQEQAANFPTTWRAFKSAGINLQYQPMEVIPNPHTFLGGVRIDETGATTVPGLFAGGEAAGGVHGANRLGANALADALGFGSILGRSAARYAKRLRGRRESLPEKEIEKELKEIYNLIK